MLNRFPIPLPLPSPSTRALPTQKMLTNHKRMRRRPGAGPAGRPSLAAHPKLPSPLILLLPFVAFGLTPCQALFADYATVPKGTNPTLYDAADFVVQLDEQTFNDTVFCSQNVAQSSLIPSEESPAGNHQQKEKCTSLVVEFYSDWCGHCRAYAQVYKALAKDLLGWSEVLKLAAINCADPINLMTCRASGITHYPFIKVSPRGHPFVCGQLGLLKYFPRNSSAEGLDTGGGGGHLLRSFQSLAAMRDQFTQEILAEYEHNRYEDWPNFDWLAEVETYGQLWEGVEEHIHTMVILFESSAESLVGAQILLDLSKNADKITARRCANNALANALQIHDFPTFAVFRRGERSPVHIAELRRLLLNEFEQFLHNETALASPPSRLLTFARRRGASNNHQELFCNANPEICRKAYFVSELDMLKSVRIALFNDVHLVGNHIAGANLSALLHFVELLANHFPFSAQVEGEGRIEFLNASSRARVVFSHLRDFIESKGAGVVISVDFWRAEFLRAELDQDNPFPTGQEWEHCKGTSPILRGFTCGLWTVFHALTVNAFKNSQKDGQFHPIAVLHTLRDWVGSFFACEHCRAHFLKMTTKLARIESLVRQKEDVFLYLWRAHNLVNARLKGRETEDPQFPKYQFPPRFLCADCRGGSGNGTGGGGGGEFDEPRVRQFLLQYYSNVRPIGAQRPSQRDEARLVSGENKSAEKEGEGEEKRT